MYNETQILVTAFINKMEAYALKSGQGDLFISCRVIINDLLRKSYINAELCKKVNHYLKKGSTLDLKELIKSDNLNDFNNFAFIDTVKAIKLPSK